MEMVSVVVVQVVSWPLVALLIWRAVRGRGGWVAWPTAIAIAANAIMALDTSGTGIVELTAATVLNIAINVLVYSYPDGRFWPRWVFVPMVAAVILQVADALSGFSLSGQEWWPLQFAIWMPCMVAALWVRYARRADAARRRAVRWVLTGLVFMLAAYLVWWLAALSLAGHGDAGPSWVSVILLTVPWAAAGVGLLWPSEVVVDPALRWTLAIGLFVVLCAGATALVAGVDDAPAVTAWITGGVFALLAVPLWAGISRLADRLVYGRRKDALSALSALDEMLAAGHAAADVPHTIVSTITSAIAVERCELRGDDGILVAATGDLATAIHDAVPAEFPILYRGQLFATARVWPRRGEQRLTARDRAVVARVCAYGGPALDGARALVALVESRARTVIAREEERKRLRRDLHDDLAPTFAGLGLSASALERLAVDGDPRAHETARELAVALSGATRHLREIAYDLRPPALDDRGLVAALHDRLAFAGMIPPVVIRAELPVEPLPAAVEAAAFRIVQEAVMNVRRHAAASRCEVTIVAGHGELRLRVVDDGIGIQTGARGGLGVRSMQERAEELGGSFRIAPGASGGTILDVGLPLAVHKAATT